MKVGLIDVDGHNFPNLPLMKLSAWHKQNGDEVEWYSPFIGLIEKYDIVYKSKVFSFTPDFNYPIYSKKTIKGGSGYCIKLIDGREVYDANQDINLPDYIEHIYPDYSLYPALTNNKAFGFLSRGCPRGCGFCHVSIKEGRQSYKVANLSEFWRGQKNIILNDPNILACPDYPDLLQQLIKSDARIEFNQGLDIRLINDENTELLKQLNFKSIHFAFDRFQDWEIIEPRLRLFKDKTGFNRGNGNVLVYILVNYDTTIDQDLARIQLCRDLNFAPFVMIYDKDHAAPIYKQMQRWANNYFIFWKVPTFEEYRNRGVI